MKDITKVQEGVFDIQIIIHHRKDDSVYTHHHMSKMPFSKSWYGDIEELNMYIYNAKYGILK